MGKQWWGRVRQGTEGTVGASGELDLLLRGAPGQKPVWNLQTASSEMWRSSNDQPNLKPVLSHQDQSLIHPWHPPGEKSHHHGRDKHNLIRTSRFPADGHSASSPFIVEIYFLPVELSILAGINQSLL